MFNFWVHVRLPQICSSVIHRFKGSLSTKMASQIGKLRSYYSRGYLSLTRSQKQHSRVGLLRTTLREKRKQQTLTGNSFKRFPNKAVQPLTAEPDESSASARVAMSLNTQALRTPKRSSCRHTSAISCTRSLRCCILSFSFCGES